MSKRILGTLLLLAAAVIVGCTSQKGPAEQALSGAESALAAVRDMAQKYVPDQLQAVDSQIAAAKDSLAKGDYPGVLAAAPKISSAVADLKSAAQQKMADAQAALAKAKEDWGSMSTDLPKAIDAIQSRVKMLSRSHHLPSGVTKDSLASAKSGLDALRAGLADASSAAASGDFTTAMAKGQELQAKAADIMKSIGLSSG